MAIGMSDGYQTLVSFASDTTVLMYEKTVTPPGLDGGGEIDITTMLNAVYRSKSPKSLKTVTEAGFTASYDPAVLSEILALVNVNNLITVTMPTGATWAFWGWLNTFTPGEHTEGEQPIATVQIIPSNVNGSGVETAPVYTPAS